ncbi:MAG: bifunctional hydroxymethylpyrimidine kinase/phosphomethylpyrimidine kinase [Prevotellaceae bacterium]|nr:bifunctional hydroxymethylpyrimidine kinase/phosphomethylpyrimidine kinase [Prevotellaceae bacterium]
MEGLRVKTILTIAASDCSAGAGIQQDLKTITSLGHYGATAITALTAQNTCGVTDVMVVPTPFFRRQLEALAEDLSIDAVKIGVVPNRGIAEAVRETVRRLGVPTVLDPVLVSTSGWQFLDEACIEYIKERLFPLCTLVTPNLPEALRLLGEEALTEDTGKQLVRRFGTSFLLKGGHREGAEAVDWLFTKEGEALSYSLPRIETHNLHGTGCTLSSAIATLLATGLPLTESVRLGKLKTQEGIRRGKDLSIGKGNGPLWLP